MRVIHDLLVERCQHMMRVATKKKDLTFPMAEFGTWASKWKNKLISVSFSS